MIRQCAPVITLWPPGVLTHSVSNPLHASPGRRAGFLTGSPFVKSDPIPRRGGPILATIRVKVAQFALELFRIGSLFGA